MNDFVKLIEPFIKFEIENSYFDDDELVEEVLAPILALADFLGENYSDVKKAYLDKENMGECLFGFIPFVLKENDSIADGIEVYSALIDFYQYLEAAKIIDRMEYFEMLAFYQENKAQFLAMVSQLMFGPDMDDDFSEGEFEDFLEAEQKEIIHELSNNKIIQFPGNKLHVTNTQATEDQELFQFRIDLAGFKPPIWRRLIVPSTTSVNELAKMIQASFEWQNSHLDMFVINKVQYQSLAQLQESDYAGKAIPSDMIMLKEVFDLGDTPASYIYDFGDYWEHKVKLEKVVNKNELSGNLSYPAVIKGKGDAPLEDSARQEQYASFDLGKINQRLKSFQK